MDVYAPAMRIVGRDSGSAPYGDPEDIADLIASLAGDDAQYITGAVVSPAPVPPCRRSSAVTGQNEPARRQAGYRAHVVSNERGESSARAAATEPKEECRS